MKNLPLKRQTSLPRSEIEIKFLKRIGRKIHKDLYDRQKPIEWLAFEAEVSRATVRRVFDADRNIGILTIDRIARGLGYKDLVDFLNQI